MAGASRTLLLISLLIAVSLHGNDARYVSKPTSHSHVSHSYPKPTQHVNSVSSHHAYPTSHGLSGGSSSGYQPRPTSNHGYPTSNGLSGSGHSGSNLYPQHTPVVQGTYGTGSGSHGYPSSSTGLSGSGHSGSIYQKPPVHTHPPYNTGSNSYYGSQNIHHSGGNQYHHNSVSNNHHSNQNVYKTTIVNHHHTYHYTPPTTIYYRSSYATHPMSYPVYSGPLPLYVYEYQSSGSRFSTLLAGLALYNLGRVSANHEMNNYHRHYSPRENEQCIFGVHYDSGNSEEMKINCYMITNFIWSEQNNLGNTLNNNVVTNQQTVVTTVNTSNYVAPNQLQPNGVIMNPSVVSNGLPQQMYPNGTLIVQPNPALSNVGTNMLPNGNIVTSSVTTTTTQVTEATDPRFHGQPVQVMPGMNCYVIRVTPISRQRHNVPCDLLQTYAAQSLKRNSALMTSCSFMSLVFSLIALLVLA